ncbi:MAG: hypothetical protein J6S30_03370 [Kiritimatiellae bacterium]|nr:hypothetical protein [Kiritimatiellia bacterium]
MMKNKAFAIGAAVLTAMSVSANALAESAQTKDKTSNKAVPSLLREGFMVYSPFLLVKNTKMIVFLPNCMKKEGKI